MLRKSTNNNGNGELSLYQKKRKLIREGRCIKEKMLFIGLLPMLCCFVYSGYEYLHDSQQWIQIASASIGGLFFLITLYFLKQLLVDYNASYSQLKAESLELQPLQQCT